MNPIEAVSSVFRNYVNFNGRAQRSEFWWFVLFSFISQAILNLIPIVGPIYILVLFLPSLAVTARRLHDTNRTSWWMLLYLIPILGFIVLFFLFIALLGISVLNQWQTNEVEWGILGISFLIWIVFSVVAWIVLLVFQIMPGTVGPNRYGPDPLQRASAPMGFRAAGHPYQAPPPAGGHVDLDPGTDPPHPDLPQGAGQRRYCTQCGSQLQPEAQFCTFCGTAV